MKTDRLRRVVLPIMLMIIVHAPVYSQGAGMLPYQDPRLPVEQRVRDLLSRMTVEEKFWQLFMIPGDLADGKEKYAHGIFGLNIRDASEEKAQNEQMLDYADSRVASETAKRVNEIQRFFKEGTRLGIPIIPFDEALHGLLRVGATCFPQSIGLAATWDTGLMKTVAGAIAKETKTRGLRDILSPVVNIARDVRWGRVEETYGEDPFLSARMAAAFVRSFEEAGIVATPKHFAANIGDGGRDSYPIHHDERLLREVYFPPFEAGVREGGARSIMTAYNSLDGKPCTANRWLLRDILKDEWKFGGFVISDAGAVGGILDLHHTVGTREESAKSAIEGGLDVIFQTDYDHHVPLLRAFTEGMVDARAVDDAVARVLRAKFQLGLFETPYVDPGEAEKWNGHPDHRALALEAARKSIVLLKNEKNALPLRKTLRSLAIIGPDAREARLGGYSGPGINKVSILKGISEKLGSRTTIVYAEGCGRQDTQVVTIAGSFFSSAGGRPGLKGEYFRTCDLSGAAAIVRQDPRVEFNWTLFPPDPSLPYDSYSVRWTGKLRAPRTGVVRIGVEGDDGYRLWIDGRLLIDSWKKESYRLRTSPLKCVKGREYDIRLEFFESRGNAQVRLVWDAGIAGAGGRIRDAVQAARRCDAVVVVAGIEEGEFRDRADIGLPGRQAEMIRRIAETGKPVVVVLVAGSAVTMSDWIDSADAIVDAWYPGEVGGVAVADVLFGGYNPGGKLPITFPQSVAQLPLYYNHKPTGRGDDYLDMSGSPLFPFGHGLSYSRFDYGGLDISPARIPPEGKALVRFVVRNSGNVAGDEVAQLYVRDLVASVARPVLELKGFERISLKPGESKEIRFELSSEQLSMLNEKLEKVVEPGDFRIMIGSSSRDIRLRGDLQVLGN